MIEKKFPWDNETGVRGLMLKNGTRHTLRCTVRETGIVATFDGKPFVNYTGGYAKLDGDYTVAGGGGTGSTCSQTPRPATVFTACN